jgi:hypothetical protein
MKQPYQLEQQEVTMLSEANLRFENGLLYREWVVSQILLKHKDKDLVFDPVTRQFMENVDGKGELK